MDFTNIAGWYLLLCLVSLVLAFALIGIVVLVLTQCMNALFVPYLQHAALALSIGLGSLINAAWLLIGLRRTGRYQPAAGWWLFALRVLVATTVLGAGLWAAAHHLDWVALREHPWLRVGALAACLVGAALVYFGTLMATGLKLKQFIRR